MKNLSPSICFKIKEARRRAGLSQSVLANEVGCKQAALSMFEQGDGTKLNEDVVKALAEKFSISLEEEKLPPPPPPQSTFITSTERGFCPNSACPSHHRYEVEGRILLKIDRAATDPVGGKYCAICGEILEKRCPNCGALVHDGAVCSICGSPYVPIMV